MEPSRLVLYVLVRLLRPTSPCISKESRSRGQGARSKISGGPSETP